LDREGEDQNETVIRFGSYDDYTYNVLCL